MCGILGYYNPRDGVTSDQLWRLALKSQHHRGPDSQGFWMDDKGNLALGHNRLAIIDCTPSGHQPMVSSSGRYVITYNGEIYNFIELRQELLSCGYVFTGSSDTEVLMAAIEKWGLSSALDHCIGMFAFGLWDKFERKLFLVRDRLGIKPLYYGVIDSTLVFASELKPIKLLLGNKLTLNYDALNIFFKKGCIPSPYSIFNEINKVEPGNIVSFHLNGTDILPLDNTAFWSIHDVVKRSLADPFQGGQAEAIRDLEILLKDAVRVRMRADVPYGAFLSGGIDSSLVVSLMQEQSAQPVNTFTIGFEDNNFDESRFANKIAKHLGTNHCEVFVTNKELLDVIPSISSIYDEPFADASQIPTFVISKLARQHVSVALSGDGGDELFGGYDRYIECYSYWKKIRLIPNPLRKIMSSVLQLFGIKNRGGRLARLNEILLANNPLALYQKRIETWAYPEAITQTNNLEHSLLQWDKNLPLSAIEQYMMTDALTYLSDDILTKVDRASMANSLEVRVPILDHRVFEFAWRLPIGFKINDGSQKWPLKKILSQYVPEKLYKRPKQGFSVPLARWLRSELKEWAEDLLHSSYLDNELDLNYKPVLQMWRQHLKGSHDRSYYLWPALILSDWLSNSWKRR